MPHKEMIKTLAENGAFSSEIHGSFGHDLTNGGFVFQQAWHAKEP
jgi:hypothetical protein